MNHQVWRQSKHQAKNAVLSGAMSYTLCSVGFWLAPYTTPVMLGAMQMVLFLTIVVPPGILLVGGVISYFSKE